MWNPGNKEIFNKAHLLTHYYKIGWIYFNWFYIISRGYILIFAESFFEWDQWMTWVFVLGIEGGELSQGGREKLLFKGKKYFWAFVQLLKRVGVGKKSPINLT